MASGGDDKGRAMIMAATAAAGGIERNSAYHGKGGDFWGGVERGGEV